MLEGSNKERRCLTFQILVFWTNFRQLHINWWYSFYQWREIVITMPPYKEVKYKLRRIVDWTILAFQHKYCLLSPQKYWSGHTLNKAAVRDFPTLQPQICNRVMLTWLLLSFTRGMCTLYSLLTDCLLHQRKDTCNQTGHKSLWAVWRKLVCDAAVYLIILWDRCMSEK